MDPFTAVGLASSIVQFIDFSFKLVAGTRAIYNSSDDASEDNLTLRAVANDVLKLTDSINVSPSSHNGQLTKIANECTAIAMELSSALEKLSVKGQKTVWGSFSLALKEVWKRKRIEGFYNRLGKVQTQLSLHIQFLMMNDMSEVLKAIRTMETTNQSLQIVRKEDLMKLKQEIIDAITSLVPSGASQTPMQQCLDQQQISSAENSEVIASVTSNLGILHDAMDRLNETGKRTESEQRLLKSLNFPNRLSRHRAIEKSHNETFEWILQGSPEKNKAPATFCDWLRKESGIYWIEGKAGSGKSTLMKLLSDHWATRKYLGEWAKGKRLVVVSFFFWSAGSKLQKSREGLLCSIIFEILRNCPDLLAKIATTFSTIEDIDLKDIWYEDELLQIYRHIMCEDTSTKFCFFIDGLDEYEDEKKGHDNIIQTIRSIKHSANTKICVSSRPWSVFRDEFGDSPKRYIKLEDLTREDIRSFVTSKMNYNRQFQELKHRDPRYPDLIEKVVKRAQGVFL